MRRKTSAQQDFIPLAFLINLTALRCISSIRSMEEDKNEPVLANEKTYKKQLIAAKVSFAATFIIGIIFASKIVLPPLFLMMGLLTFWEAETHAKLGHTSEAFSNRIICMLLAIVLLFLVWGHDLNSGKVLTITIAKIAMSIAAAVLFGVTVLRTLKKRIE